VKKSPNAYVAQLIFWQSLYVIYAYEKRRTKMWATSAIYRKKLPTVNSRSLGENSPNLVTLIPGSKKFSLK
jgi:hypothetical protein